MVESLLVVGSILLALALDEWNEGQDYQDLATLSLVNFEREIQQNRLRLEDVTPFHVGLRDVLANMDAGGAAVPAATIRNVLGVCAAEAQAAGQDGSGVCGDVADWGHDGLGRVSPMSRDGWVVGGRGEQGCRGPFTGVTG